MSILDRSVRRRVDCIFCFVCLFLFLMFSLQRNEGFCVCSFGLSPGFSHTTCHAQGREGSGGDDDDDDDDDDLVIMMIIIMICSSNSVKL